MTIPPSLYVIRYRVYGILRRHPGLFLALLIYLGLAFSYFFIVPIFEGPDEWTHAGHVKYMAEGHGLPVMLPGQGIWGGQQPPLYYAIGALIVQPFNLAGVEKYEEQRRNPHASIGYALDPGNKNNYLHAPAENFPYRGLSLTVHVLRLYSMLYGLIALIFTYLTAYELGNSQFSILNSQFIIHNSQFFAAIVALFVAAQPMFAFITASVANEPANIAFCAIGLWLAQRYVLRGPTPHWGRAAALGITLGLISLSKMTGLSFGLVAVVAMLITAITTRKQPGAAQLLWRDGIIIGMLFLAVGGWWYARNYRLYGDFFQQGLYKLYFNVNPQPLTLREFLNTLASGEVSFWATFGWLNIAAPEWVYSFYRIISRVGVAGVVVTAVGQTIQHFRINTIRNMKYEIPVSPLASPLRVSPLLLHLTFPLALAFSLTRLVAIEGGMQGRQLLPALGAIAIVIVWGWWKLTPQRWAVPVLTVLTAALVGIAAWLPYQVVVPAYIPQPFLTEADLPADLPRLNLTYRDEMRLIGVKIEAAAVQPGDTVPITVYWQALKRMPTDYSIFIHLFGRGQADAGQLNTYPGLGLRPTSTLEPGQIVADTYPVLVYGSSAAPTRLQVILGLFNFKEPGRPSIEPITLDGQPASSRVGQLKLVPAQWPAVNTPPLAEFADHIQLLEYSLENCQVKTAPCQVSFIWAAQGRPVNDYTVFIQLWRDNQPAAGFDAPPLGNDYPTSLWDKGEVIIDPHPLDLSKLPAGEYRVLAGFYNFTSGARLPAAVQGIPLADYAVDLGLLKVQ